MKLKYFLSVICALLCLMIPHISHGTIIDGYFKGVIYLDESDPGIWSDDIQGRKISGYFTYDTASAPDATEPYPGLTSYSSYNHWLDLFFYIDGRKIDALSVARNDIPLQQSEGVLVSDSFLDGFFQVGMETTGDDSLGNYVESRIWVTIAGVPGLITDDSLSQSFSWQRKDTYPASAIIVELGQRDGIPYATHLEMYITKMTLVARNTTSVPEPSSFIIFALGVLGLLFNYRRNR